MSPYSGKPLVFICVVAIFITGAHAAFARTVPTNAIEQTEDLYLHTGAGASGSSTVLKCGLGILDGPGAGTNGNAVVLLKWDLTAFPASIASVMGDIQRIGGDGSFAVHQMTVDWSEATDLSAFGGGLPQPAVHYVAAPIAAFGFNEKNDEGFPQRADRFDLSRLFQQWRQDPGLNKGIICIPRGRLNSAYPESGYAAPTGVFDDELTLQSREQTPGIVSANDQWVAVAGGAAGQAPEILEPIEDTAILEGAPHNPGQGDQASTSLFDGAGQRHYALYKFGLGELMLDGLDRGGGDFVFTRADFIVEAPAQSNSIRDVGFTIHQMLNNWDEATATWAQFGGGSGPQPDVDFDSISLGTGFLGQGATSATVDVRNAANQWLSDPFTNFGLILIPVSADSMGDAMSPHSSEDEIFSEGPPVLEGDDTRLVVAITLAFRPAILESLNVSMGTAAVAFDSQAGIEYSLDARSDTNDWVDTGLRLTGNGGTMHFLVAPGPEYDRSFRIWAQEM
jgi:hypothetical protein